MAYLDLIDYLRDLHVRRVPMYEVPMYVYMVPMYEVGASVVYSTQNNKNKEFLKTITLISQWFRFFMGAVKNTRNRNFVYEFYNFFAIRSCARMDLRGA